MYFSKFCSLRDRSSDGTAFNQFNSLMSCAQKLGVQGAIKTCNAPNISRVKSCVIETRIWSAMRDFIEKDLWGIWKELSFLRSTSMPYQCVILLFWIWSKFCEYSWKFVSKSFLQEVLSSNSLADVSICMFGKTCRTRRHVCAIFQACCAIFLPVNTHVLFFLHFAVKFDIKDGWIDTL